MSMTTGNAIVDKISKLGINSIPDAWYQNLRRPKSNTLNSLAVLVLWDLLYWYKWTEVKNETSGLVIGYKKKFKADLLQRSYSAIANKFGVTKRAAMETVMFLEEIGVVRKECRTITVGDQKLGNVLFIALVPEKIAEISEFKTLECNTSYTETEDLLHSDVIAVTSECKTNTNNSTTTSTTNSTNPSEPTPFDEPTPNPFDEDRGSSQPSQVASSPLSAKPKRKTKKSSENSNSYPRDYYNNVVSVYNQNYQKLLDAGKVKAPLPKIVFSSISKKLKQAFDDYGYESVLEGVKRSVDDEWLIQQGYPFFYIFGPQKLSMLINNQSFQNNTATSKKGIAQSLKNNNDYEEWKV